MNNVVKKLLVFCVLFTIHVRCGYERHITVVCPSYNNQDWYKLHLDSIFRQKYENYDVIYINDASTDKTLPLVYKYIKTCNKQDKVKLINNKYNRGAMANLYYAIHEYCAPDDIVAVLDGDDWFAHDHVLQRVNKEYENPNTWLTYGSYKDVPETTRPCSDIVKKVQTSTKPLTQLIQPFSSFLPGHLKTFYAGLFQQIKFEDILYNGKYAATAYDVAINYPMHEMARHHFTYIPDILYIHNCLTPLNDHKVHKKSQGNTGEMLKRTVPRYHELTDPCAVPAASIEKNYAQGVDLVFFADNSPEQAYGLIADVQLNELVDVKAYLFTNTDSEIYRNNVTCIICESQEDSVATLVYNILKDSQAYYVIVADCSAMPIENLSLKACIKALGSVNKFLSEPY